MKKLLPFCIVILSIIEGSVSSFSQIIVAGTGFDNYANTSGTAPAGWYMSWHSASPASSYTTAANSGVAIPSYKFGLDSVTVITPVFQNADTLSFMCRGNGVPFGDTNELHIYHSTDSISWNIFVNRDSLPATKTTLKYGLPAASGWLKFVYRKLGNGNLAFDDVNIISYPNIYSAFTANSASVCLGDSICFTDQSISNNGAINYWEWNFGDPSSANNISLLQNPCHTYSTPGTYTVCLVVKNINNDADTSCFAIAISPTPVAGFSSTLTGNVVSFTDTSTGGTSYLWDFGDGNFSTAPNPTPYAYASTGTYTICQMVTNNDSCMDIFCQTVIITTVGINEADISSSINIFPTISENGIFTIQNLQFAIQGVEVYNAVGEKIYSLSPSVGGAGGGLSLDLSKEHAGIYFVKILSDNYFVTKKVVFSK